jgi:hypothetical protein
MSLILAPGELVKSPNQHIALVQQAFNDIATAVSVSAVKHVRDQWDVIAAYARKRKDKQIEADAREIRKRAERKIGELIAAQKATVGLNKGGRPKTGLLENPVSEPKPFTLAEIGIDKNLANAARKEAAKSKEEFEADLAEDRADTLAEHKPFVPSEHNADCTCWICEGKRGKAAQPKKRWQVQQERAEYAFDNTVCTIHQLLIDNHLDMDGETIVQSPIPSLDVERLDEAIAKLEEAQVALVKLIERIKEARAYAADKADDTEASVTERKAHYAETSDDLSIPEYLRREPAQ